MQKIDAARVESLVSRAVRLYVRSCDISYTIVYDVVELPVSHINPTFRRSVEERVEFELPSRVRP